MSQEIANVEDLSPRQNAILSSLRIGNTRKAACEAIGVDRTTLYRWMQRDATFSLAVKAAEADAEQEFAGIIRHAARGGDLRKRTITKKPDGTVTAVEEWTVGDWRAAAYWLDHRKRAWAPPQEIDLSKLPDDQLIRVLRILEEEAEGGSGEEEFEGSEATGGD